jgi:hypothetical protein
MQISTHPLLLLLLLLLLQGLANHLYSDVECRWVDANVPSTEPYADLNISAAAAASIGPGKAPVW